jgi:glycosyltransferase involved in cell wall biosynthesis
LLNNGKVLIEATMLDGKISIIIPAYNEGRYIYNNLQEFVRIFSKLGIDFEIIVVDDGSTDNTLQEANKLDDNRLKVVSYNKNQGKGYALKYGIKHATGRYITFIDADMDLPPEQLTVFMEKMKETGADIVIGSKRHPGSKLQYPFHRKFLSYCYQALIALLFKLDVTDTQTGLKLIKKEAIGNIIPKVTIKKYAFDLEFLVIGNRLGYAIVEAPIVIDFRFKSSVNAWAILQIFFDTLLVFYRGYILKAYDS